MFKYVHLYSMEMILLNENTINNEGCKRNLMLHDANKDKEQYKEIVGRDEP